MVRSFVAIDLPEGIKDALEEVAAEQRALVPERSVRWSRIAGIHLTLKFLGNVAKADVPAIMGVLEQICADHAPFSFTVSGLGCFPNRRRPRVLWVGVEEDAGKLAGLQRDVERHLEPLGFEREKRAFHPHLTLGRARRGVSSYDQARIGEVVASSDVEQLGDVYVEKIHLMRSDLRSDGAVYTSLKSFTLGAQGAPEGQ